METELGDIKQVSIIGVGLLGGSIGLFVKREFPFIKVVGVGRSEDRLKEALSRGAIDEYTLDPATGVRDSDLVIIATPVSTIVPLYKAVLPYLKPSSTVTDIGSTKASIVQEISLLGDKEKDFFVGSHPMTGLEESGVLFSNPDIYKNAVVLVVKEDSTNAQRLLVVISFWKSLGSTVQLISKEEHDRVVSLTSHLPHIIASALTFTLFNEEGLDKWINKGAFGKGLLDTTRIASGEVNMWSDIILSNRENILEGIKFFKESLSVMGSLIEAASDDKLKVLLAVAKEWRLHLPLYLSSSKPK